MHRLLVVLGLLAGCDRVFSNERIPGESSPRGIVFDNSAGTVDLVEMPVMLELDDSTIDVEVVLDPMTDLRFHDPDTDTDLPFEIETWDPAGSSIVWVRVPKIDARSSDDAILVYFGENAAGTPPNPADVWATYDLVYHGHTDANAASTSFKPTRTAGVGYAPGLIGDGVRLSGTGDRRVTFAGSQSLFNAWPTFTLELWVYPDYATANLNDSEPGIVGNGSSINNGRLFSPTTEGPLIMQIDVGFVAGTSFSNVYMPHGVWSHVVYAFDGQTLLLYRNGVFSDLDLVGTSALRSSSNPLELGERTTALNGIVDEFRASRAYRGPDWVYAQYLAMTRKFVRFVPGDDVAR